MEARSAAVMIALVVAMIAAVVVALVLGLLTMAHHFDDRHEAPTPREGLSAPPAAGH